MGRAHAERRLRTRHVEGAARRAEAEADAARSQVRWRPTAIRRALQEITESTSWRLTAPLRKINALRLHAAAGLTVGWSRSASRIARARRPSAWRRDAQAVAQAREPLRHHEGPRIQRRLQNGLLTRGALVVVLG